MTDYEYRTDSPFCAYSNEIKSVEIRDGVTSVGSNSFTFCYDIESVLLSDSITSIGDYAFLGCVSMDTLRLPESVESIGDHALGYYCVNGTSGTYYNARLALIGKSDSAAESYAKENGCTFTGENIFTGTCGENLTWKLTWDTGVFEVSGEGGNG